MVLWATIYEQKPIGKKKKKGSEKKNKWTQIFF